MSQSYTILPYINPPAGAYDHINAIATQNNSFTVSQTFGAGIVDSGDLSVAGASTLQVYVLLVLFLNLMLVLKYLLLKLILELSLLLGLRH